MIKLIASDLDGTLLPEGTANLNPELFTVIRELMARGICFVAASGRQYDAILNVFEPLKHEIGFIADNGAYIIKNEELLYCNSFPGDTWQAIIRHVQEYPDEMIMLSSVEGSFADRRCAAFRQQIYDGYGLVLEPVDDLTALDVHVTKIGVYCTKRNPKQSARRGRELFGDAANIVVSGECWMDYVPVGVDKGYALQRIQEHLGISPEETMAFGDNINDLGMLRRASESYAVSNARQEVKDAVKHVMMEGAEDEGVLHILQKLLNQLL